MLSLSSHSSLPDENLGKWAQDFLAAYANININKNMNDGPEGMNALMRECSKLGEENQVLKRCLRIMRDNTALETASLLSAVVAFCDGKFRKKFADGLDRQHGVPIPAQGKGAKVYRETTPAGGQPSGGTEWYGMPTQEQFASAGEDEPVRDSSPPRQTGGSREPQDIHEVPVRDSSPPKRPGPPRQIPCCTAVCSQSPPVSLGGRQIKSTDVSPYFYPSEPTSKHLQSHMQTNTPFVTDLEYDSLYLRSLTLAAKYRAMAQGLDKSAGAAGGEGGEGPAKGAGGEDKKYQFVEMDKLCRMVSGIPPHILYKQSKKWKPARLIHTCVGARPTKCYPFTREGKRSGAALSTTVTGRKEKVNFTLMPYTTDERSHYSPLNVPTERPCLADRSQRQSHRYHNAEDNFRIGRTKRRDTKYPQSSDSDLKTFNKPNTPRGKGRGKKKPGDYDFETMVGPIIEQAKQNLSQVTGQKPFKDDLTSYSLKHTHKEYQYKEDGTAVVQADVYKKSFNWNSDENLNSGPGGGGGTASGATGQAGNREDLEKGVEKVMQIATGCVLGPEVATELNSIVQDVAASISDKTPSPHPDDVKVPIAVQGSGRMSSPKGSNAKLTDSGHVHWDPKTRFDTHDSHHLAEAKDQEEGRTQKEHPDASNNKANNEYLGDLDRFQWRDRHQATSQWLAENCGPFYGAEDDRDWASHCYRDSPLRMPTTRHSAPASSSTPDELFFNNVSRGPSGQNSMRDGAEREWEAVAVVTAPTLSPNPVPSPKSWISPSGGSGEAEALAAPARSPSPKTWLSTLGGSAEVEALATAVRYPYPSPKSWISPSLGSSEEVALAAPARSPCPKTWLSTLGASAEVEALATAVRYPNPSPKSWISPSLGSIEEVALASLARPTSSRSWPRPSVGSRGAVAAPPTRSLTPGTWLIPSGGSKEAAAAAALALSPSPGSWLSPSERSRVEATVASGPRSPSPRTWLSPSGVCSREAGETPAAAHNQWQPSPRLDFYPVSQRIAAAAALAAAMPTPSPSSPPLSTPQNQQHPDLMMMMMMSLREEDGEGGERRGEEERRREGKRRETEISLVDTEEEEEEEDFGNSNSNNLLGEVAYQLERRILDYVFASPDQVFSSPSPSPCSPFLSLPPAVQGGRGGGQGEGAQHRRGRRLGDGYTISNIGEMISKHALAGERYSRGTERMLRERLRTMLDLLTPMGYDLLEHGAFSKNILNKYGILATPPVPEGGRRGGGMGVSSAGEVGIPGMTVADIQNFIFSATKTDEERDTLLLILDCLRLLAIEDGRPLFIW